MSELQDLTKDELKEKAADLGIDGRSSMTKDELVRAIEDYEDKPELADEPIQADVTTPREGQGEVGAGKYDLTRGTHQVATPDTLVDDDETADQGSLGGTGGVTVTTTGTTTT